LLNIQIVIEVFLCDRFIVYNQQMNEESEWDNEDSSSVNGGPMDCVWIFKAYQS